MNRCQRGDALLAAGAALAALGVLALIGRGGWPGGMSGCIAATDCSCETIRSGLIAQPANTLTSLFFVLAGMSIVVIGSRSRRAAMPAMAARTYGIAVILAGLGSAAFHASLREWGGWADLLGAAAILAFPIVYRSTTATQGWFLARYTALLGGLGGLLWMVETGNGKYVLAVLGLLAITAEVVTMIGPADGVGRDRRWLAGTAFLLALGGGVWWFSRTDGVLCSPEAGWQWHGVWHAAAATALLTLFLYWRSETKPGALPGQGIGAGCESD